MPSTRNEKKRTQKGGPAHSEKDNKHSATNRRRWEHVQTPTTATKKTRRGGTSKKTRHAKTWPHSNANNTRDSRDAAHGSDAEDAENTQVGTRDANEHRTSRAIATDEQGTGERTEAQGRQAHAQKTTTPQQHVARSWICPLCLRRSPHRKPKGTHKRARNRKKNDIQQQQRKDRAPNIGMEKQRQGTRGANRRPGVKRNRRLQDKARAARKENKREVEAQENSTSAWAGHRKGRRHKTQRKGRRRQGGADHACTGTRGGNIGGTEKRAQRTHDASREGDCASNGGADTEEAHLSRSTHKKATK
ncbi:hypothetical protein TvY486_0023000 [Trypanosoma vivax Y486]|uniref:Uncharacterized protein n=1 Tax=Trypanosoma vivax (strain Y486) TaxID=1055687 RepID=F9WPX1_TRYVY|nr:hypothetical protein TvY486_0023000 [Trypanosoma vivax Y486]|eukprot:CCD19598.1 hypothetical protein TvY486_0023000 [Trypanosoma vivax Y486]